MRRPHLVLIVAAAAVACSPGDGRSDAPPATRDVDGNFVVTTIGPPSTEAVEGATGATAPPASDTAAEVAGPEYSIAWEVLGDRLDGGWLTVPLDHADPDGATIDLWVVRHRAREDDRIGSLLTNPGGPGAAGSTVAQNASSYFTSDVVDRFDIIGWDPRGTGISDGAVDCIDDAQYDEFFSSADITPDDEGERQVLVDLARRFAEGCVERVGEPLRHVGTNNSARDMDAIRRALGEDQVSYFGFSYGSELGGVWATMYPETVRAAVFDGAADPGAGQLAKTRQQWLGFEAAFDRFLEGCSADSSCAFHNGGAAGAAYDELLRRLDEEPAATVEGRVPVNQAVLTVAVLQSMYSDSYWPALERSLADAANGDGTGLLQLHDAYNRRGEGGDYADVLEAFRAIECADTAERPSVAKADAVAQESLVGIAPRVFPDTTGSYFCTFFPEALDPRIEITGAGAGPIVVIGTTGDPSTPLESSRRMAETLEDGRLVIVDANRHGGYLDSGCAQDIVSEYLIWLEPPESGTECT